MTVGEVLKVCDNVFKIELCCKVEMYGKENYVTIAYRHKEDILAMINENENGTGEIASKEVKLLTWHILNESCICIVF